MNNSFIPPETFLVSLILFGAVGYVYGAYVLYRIGNKFGVGSFGEYCIPVYNYVLLCRCAQIPPVRLFWLLVPFANLGFLVYLWGTLSTKLGHNFWIFGLGMFLIGIPAFILAFDQSRPAVRRGTLVEEEPSVICISGEFSGSRLPVRATGLILGRSAEKSNVVLASPEVSAVHARLWSDPDGRVWVEDLRSSNGTYYCQPQPGEALEWVQIDEPVALLKGFHLRLGENSVEFVVS